MNKKFMTIIFLLVILIPVKTKAIICSNEDKVRLQNLAQNVTTSYDYIEQNGTVIFTATISNIHEDLIIKDVTNEITYPYKGSEIKIDNLKPDKTYRFDVVTDKYYCHHEKLYSHYVNTPSYNQYYKDAVCKGVENLPLCNKWQKITVSYDEFKKKVEESKKVSEEEIIKPTVKHEKGIYDYLLEFYLNYYYIILPIFIIGGIVIIYRYNKKNDLF